MAIVNSKIVDSGYVTINGQPVEFQPSDPLLRTSCKLEDFMQHIDRAMVEYRITRAPTIATLVGKIDKDEPTGPIIP